TNYRFVDNRLIDTTNNKEYFADDIFIVTQYRFEGMSNPSDMSILYIIRTKDKSKGTMLIGYGPTGDIELADFFDSIPEKNFCNDKDLL
ncbi:hypothetical protein J9332_40635, partial [Aquimarina celericrescens]|nr:hypothetical protein [Aquimarina celericrescens]